MISRVARPHDFVYLDPPFAVANRRLFRQYNGTTFGFDDLYRLANLLHALDALGAHFVLSYAVCTESLAAFSGWRVRRVLTQRNISGFAAHRRRAAELIVTNIQTLSLEAPLPLNRRLLKLFTGVGAPSERSRSHIS